MAMSPEEALVRMTAYAQGCKEEASLFTKPRGRGWAKFGEKYQATITCAGKRLYLGTYNTAEEAYQVYKEAHYKFQALKLLGRSIVLEDV